MTVLRSRDGVLIRFPDAGALVATAAAEDDCCCEPPPPPCPPPSCSGVLTLPWGYTFSAGVSGGGGDCRCALWDGDWLLIIGARVKAKLAGPLAPYTVYDLECLFASIWPEFVPPWAPLIDANDDFWVLKSVGDGSGLGGDPCLHTVVAPAAWEAVWTLDGMGMARLEVFAANGGTGSTVFATYHSAWMPVGDVSTTPVTVTKQSSALCTFDDELTLTPLGEAAGRMFAGCDDPCPALADGDDNILIVEGTIGGVDFRVCLGYQGFDPAFGSWTYLGVLAGFTGGTCSDETLTFRLRCDGGEWVLDVTQDTTTVTVPVSALTADPVSGTISGTLTGICGDAAIVADLSVCVSAGLVFPACCDLTDAEKCCVTEIPPFVTSGSAVGGPGQGTISWTGSVAWDPDHVDGPGWYANVAFTFTGCTPAKPQLNAATSITCDSGGTFQLLMPDLLSIVDTDTGGCPTVGGVTLSFQMQILGGWCDGSDANVTLIFTA